MAKAMDYPPGGPRTLSIARFGERPHSQMTSPLRFAQQPDIQLSRFNPLPRIMFYDDFSQGMSGWTELLGNYTGSLRTMHPGYRQFTPPMLSNLTQWDGGTHGALTGSYALKLATRPGRGSQTVSLKRLTFPRACTMQMECFFTYKPEATELELSDRDVRSFGVVLDIQDSKHRVLPQVRYLNSLNGEPQNKWQYKPRSIDFKDVGDRTVTIYHYGEENWVDIPGGQQQLCYNEIPTKVNWHYFRLGFDIRTLRYTELQCNDLVIDLSGLDMLKFDAMPNLQNLFNVIPFVDSDSDKRAFLYFDSILLSGDW